MKVSSKRVSRQRTVTSIFSKVTRTDTHLRSEKLVWLQPKLSPAEKFPAWKSKTCPSFKLVHFRWGNMLFEHFYFPNVTFTQMQIVRTRECKTCNFSLSKHKNARIAYFLSRTTGMRDLNILFTGTQDCETWTFSKSEHSNVRIVHFLSRNSGNRELYISLDGTQESETCTFSSSEHRIATGLYSFLV